MKNITMISKSLLLYPLHPFHTTCCTQSTPSTPLVVPSPPFHEGGGGTSPPNIFGGGDGYGSVTPNNFPQGNYILWVTGHCLLHLAGFSKIQEL